MVSLGTLQLPQQILLSHCRCHGSVEFDGRVSEVVGMIEGSVDSISAGGCVVVCSLVCGWLLVTGGRVFGCALPNSHRKPVNPGRQLHRDTSPIPDSRSQVPPFMHGLVSQVTESNELHHEGCNINTVPISWLRNEAHFGLTVSIQLKLRCIFAMELKKYTNHRSVVFRSTTTMKLLHWVSNRVFDPYSHKAVNSFWASLLHRSYYKINFIAKTRDGLYSTHIF